MGAITRSAMTSRYAVKEVKVKSEMDQIMEVIWSANYDPYDTFAQLFFPDLGYTPSSRATALEESKQRFWTLHTLTTTSHWFYVEEAATGKFVGCAQWERHEKNPFQDTPQPMRAPWWPEGDYRDFCEEIMRQAYLPRMSWMRRPHLALNWMAVLPAYRRRGVGSLLMNVGIEQADAIGVECWMEASTMGKALYENHGFRSLFKIQFDMERKNATDTWRRCMHELTPTPVYPMWRPKYGVWEPDGGAGMPWALGAA